jgi:uncharacterized repeat protein (TIGR03803 family)
MASMVLGLDGSFYGTTYSGGSAHAGSVFKMTSTGQVTVLHSFNDGSIAEDGVNPQTGLLLGSDGNFYGTTYSGGPPVQGGSGWGVLFRITPQGVYSILHYFSDGTVLNDGRSPNGGLVEGPDGAFYGVTIAGGTGTYSGGTVYRITPQGMVSILHNFADSTVPNDGSDPVGNLTVGPGGNLYGVTASGGSNEDQGIIFMISPSGASYSVLHVFGSVGGMSDGASPTGGLVLGPDGNFYGTRVNLGSSASDFFKITPQGAETDLSSAATVAPGLPGPLTLGPDGNFYGMGARGGLENQGAIFCMAPSGNVTVLHSIGDGSIPGEGGFFANAVPAALVLGSDGDFYGTLPSYGTAGFGTVFKLVPGGMGLINPVSVNGSVGLPFRYAVTTTTQATNFSAVNLPVGLSLDPATGVISGTPTTTGTNVVALTLKNSATSNPATLTINISPLPAPAITSAPVAFGTQGSAFDYTVVASGKPTSFAASGLPNGLSIDAATGIISGSSSVAVTASATISATNSSGTGTATLNIQIFGSSPTPGQEYVNYYGFGTADPQGLDEEPLSLIQGFDGDLYGTALVSAMIYDLKAQGTFTTAFSFPSFGVGSPNGLLQGADGNFYVTGSFTSSMGGVAKITPQGNYTALAALGDSGDGLNEVPLTQASDGNFYGVTTQGGTGAGTIFRLTPGGAVTVLHTFQDGSVSNDGSAPCDPLVQGADGNLYGSAQYAGTGFAGIIFKMTLQGQYSIIHVFSGTVKNSQGQTVSDGNYPRQLIVGGDGNLYGVTYEGGLSGNGTAFKMTTAGVETILHSFDSAGNDGTNPTTITEGNDGNFYGTTTQGGASGDGVIFEVTGAGFETQLHNFGSVSNDGQNPKSLFTGQDGNLYGTCGSGGSTSIYDTVGTAFALIVQQAPTHVPIFTGAAAGSAPINSIFSFTPKAQFGVYGSLADTASAVQPVGSLAGIEAMFVSIFEPATASANWTMSGTLPTGLNFDAASGTISGSVATAGTTTITMTPHNSVGPAAAATTVTLTFYAPPVISSVATATATVNANFKYTITSSGSPTSFNATFLPAWLSLNSSTGVLSGTPNFAGVYVFDVMATNAAGTGMETVTLTVGGGPASAPTISSATTMSGPIDSAFTYQIAASQNPTSFSASGLPPGLLFNSASGLIYGTTTTSGTFLMPISATNASGTTVSSVTVTIAGLAPPRFPPRMATTGTPGSLFSYQIPATGLVTLYTATGLPAGLTLNSQSGLITGTPTGTGDVAVTVTAQNSAGITTATLGLVIGTPASNSFGSWSGSYGASAIPTATPENDGLPNLLKYVFNIAPNSSMSATDRAALPTLGEDTTSSPGTTYLELTFREYASLSGYAVQLQTSTDMLKWTTVTPAINQIVAVDPSTNDPVREMGVVFTGGDAQFIRLNVTPIGN